MIGKGGTSSTLHWIESPDGLARADEAARGVESRDAPRRDLGGERPIVGIGKPRRDAGRRRADDPGQMEDGFGRLRNGGVEAQEETAAFLAGKPDRQEREREQLLIGFAAGQAGRDRFLGRPDAMGGKQSCRLRPAACCPHACPET
jgi:hypothetical protein